MRWVLEHAAAQNPPVKIEQDAARELVDALGADMMLVANELEKLMLFAGDKRQITLGDVETMVLAAKQRSLYELTDAISRRIAPGRFRAGRTTGDQRRRGMPLLAISTCWPRRFARCW